MYVYVLRLCIFLIQISLACLIVIATASVEASEIRVFVGYGSYDRYYEPYGNQGNDYGEDSGPRNGGSQMNNPLSNIKFSMINIGGSGNIASQGVNHATINMYDSENATYYNNYAAIGKIGQQGNNNTQGVANFKDDVEQENK